MRKLIFGIIILFIVTVNTAFGQIKPFKFGVKVSPNISWLKPIQRIMSRMELQLVSIGDLLVSLH